jgi:prepilin-type N-terminal cleavage/methylation domain-containing protein
MSSDERGLSLVEVLAAIALVGIGLTGLFAVVPISTYGIQEGSQLSTATFLAEQRLEEVRSAMWQASVPAHDCIGVGAVSAPTSNSCTRATPTLCTSGAPCVTYPDETSVPGYPGYRRTVRVIDCAGAPGCGTAPHTVTDANLRLVTVSVGYRPMSGVGAPSTGTKSVDLHLLVAKR